MKKICSFLIAITLCFVCFCSYSCSTIDGNSTNVVTEVLDPIKLYDKSKCADTSIKFDSVSYYITPAGFDLDKLDKRGYRIKIEVTYNVHYKKDYNVLFDIGYFGSPKYEVYISNSEGWGSAKENLSTKLSDEKHTISYDSNAVNYKNTKISLIFSTDNIQNTIYFSNIIVEYTCYR